MSSDLVAVVRDIYQQAVAAVLPAAVISRTVRVDDDGHLNIDSWTFNLSERPAYAIAVGKAAGEMMMAIESILGERLADGIVVTKSFDDGLDLRSRVLLGSHPVPDNRSLEAGAAVLEFAEAVPERALVLCLISGGGSALMESLRPGVTLDELQQTTKALLRAGASIHELNAVRARLSAIKAGGLLAVLAHAEVVNLIISDVLGDDLSTIASGPTVPRATSEPAEEILRRYGIEQALPEIDDAVAVPEPRTSVVANLGRAVDAAAKAARGHGYEPVVLSRSLSGEARHVATTIAAVAADTAAGVTSLPAQTCILCGGETTVTVHGDGVGGRNTESALVAALRLRGVEGVAIGYLATDGDDAETGVAGGIVTGETIPEDVVQEARRALDENDTYTFLEQVGAAWGLGVTGTNVNDLIIAVVR